LGVSKQERQSSGAVLRSRAVQPRGAESRVASAVQLPDVSAEVAHELNQALSATMSYIKATKRTLASIAGVPTERTDTLLNAAAEETLRAGSIVRTLRWLGERRIRARESVDLNRLIEDSIASGTTGEGLPRVEIHLDLDRNLPLVPIDKARIEQVLLQLIRNSVEAMAGLERRDLTVCTRVDDEGFAEVSVTDSGSGLPPAVIERLFHPFVTTKEKRLGVGLAICRSIVESHGGTIWAIEQQPQGAGFIFRLPIDEEGEAFT
jgi:two-component system, LuxR family, sensor kinase FixL